MSCITSMTPPRPNQRQVDLLVRDLQGDVYAICFVDVDCMERGRVPGSNSTESRTEKFTDAIEEDANRWTQTVLTEFQEDRLNRLLSIRV